VVTGVKIVQLLRAKGTLLFSRTIRSVLCLKQCHFSLLFIRKIEMIRNTTHISRIFFQAICYQTVVINSSHHQRLQAPKSYPHHCYDLVSHHRWLVCTLKACYELIMSGSIFFIMIQYASIACETWKLWYPWLQPWIINIYIYI
jgi:hypothetical protein